MEAAIVRDGVDGRPPDEAERIRARFGEAVARLKAAGLHGRLEDRASLRTAEQMRALGLDYFRAGVACPFLVDESCGIYAVRPMKCREYMVNAGDRRGGKAGVSTSRTRWSPDPSKNQQVKDKSYLYQRQNDNNL